MSFRIRALTLVLILPLLSGCLDSFSKSRVERSPTSMVWLTRSSEPLEVSSLVRLQDVGIGEAMVSGGTIESGAAGVRVSTQLPDGLPPSMPITLVLHGRELELAEEEVQEAADEVAGAARSLRFEAESQGPIPVGVHLDLRRIPPLPLFAEFLAAVRKQVDDSLTLSLSLHRSWLGREGIEDVVKEVDYVVPFLYGQPVHESEDDSAWDFISLERSLSRVEELDVPYFLGITSLGNATLKDSGGSIKSRKTPISLQEILWNRDVELQSGFSLEGVNRRVYNVKAGRSTKVNTWDLNPGDEIRVVRAASSDIEELQRLLAASELPNLLGTVYYRLPSAEEKLSLSLENLLNALDSDPATPQLELGVQLQRRTGRGWLVRFSITNRNGEITELSLMDSNYLQVKCHNGVFGRAAIGDFYRYDLYSTNADGELERTFRRSDIIRLHVPLLEGEQRVESGDIEVHVTGQPRFSLTGSFLLTDGRVWPLGPVEHPGG